MTSIKHATTTADAAADAAVDIQRELAPSDPRLVLYFGSSEYDQDELARAMNAAFPDAEVIGCSTAGEVASGAMTKGGLVAMGFDEVTIPDVHVEVVRGVKDASRLDDALAGFERHFGTPVADMDYREYVGIVLIDGLSVGEERLMDALGDRTNVLFVGGSAGDDLKFSATHVHANGQSWSDAAVLALLKPGVQFDIVKTQSFDVLDKQLTVTRANEETRQVLEFDGRPAAEAYAEALGTTVDDLPNHFMKHPLGLIAGDEPFVRSPQKIEDDGTVTFYCNILEGMELSVLEAGDMVSDTRKALEDKQRDMGGLDAVVNFHCILRTLDLEASERTQDYADVFADVPTIGFSTYGEEYLGHINQTSTMLVFHGDN